MTPKTIARIERLIWPLIFAGLLLACLGVAVQQADEPLGGWLLLPLGGLATALGMLLIYLRSRSS